MKTRINRGGSRRQQTVLVVYAGIANVYINFGIRFDRGVPTRVPAALVPEIQAAGVFEIIGSLPEPEPAAEEVSPVVDEE